ncbi:MAG TPA: hypothetical protein VMT52_09635, partial [Planctomycetota bacterium]|nr:hypothetical protein [Planctomycetota bacterium]
MRTRSHPCPVARSGIAPFVLFLSLLGSVAGSGDCLGLTIEVDTGAIDFIVVGDDWRFFRGRESPSNPSGAWR